MGRKKNKGENGEGEGKKKGGKLKKLFFLSALAGVGAAIFKKKSAGEGDAGWEEAKPPAEGSS